MYCIIQLKRNKVVLLCSAKRVCYALRIKEISFEFNIVYPFFFFFYFIFFFFFFFFFFLLAGRVEGGGIVWGRNIFNLTEPQPENYEI